MQVTEEGLALIRRHEGFRAEAYRCPAGIWTIGYGHTAQAGPPVVTPGMTVSEEEGARILARDVARFAAEVKPLLAREVSAAQFSALVSFAYNVGTPAFRRSSVLRAVNEGRFGDVPHRLKLWVKAGGKVLPGLEKRRAAEARLFMSDVTPSRSIALPEAEGRRHEAAGGLAALAALLAAGLGGAPWWVLSGLALAGAAIAGWLWLKRRRTAEAGGAP